MSIWTTLISVRPSSKTNFPDSRNVVRLWNGDFSPFLASQSRALSRGRVNLPDQLLHVPCDRAFLCQGLEHIAPLETHSDFRS